uniref:Putative secreted protein n=1 Tax=Amblyomma triste TaxID=251400 RepID=A0A023G5E0_AMBTT
MNGKTMFSLIHASFLITCIMSTSAPQTTSGKAAKLLGGASPIKYILKSEVTVPFLGLNWDCVTAEVRVGGPPYITVIDVTNGSGWQTHLYSASVNTFAGPEAQDVITFQAEDHDNNFDMRAYRLVHAAPENCFVLATTYSSTGGGCYLFSKVEIKAENKENKQCPPKNAETTACDSQFTSCKEASPEDEICLAWL